MVTRATADTACRQTKHLALAEAVDQLHIEVGRLQDLYDEVTGSARPQEPKEPAVQMPSQPPTLLEVLDTGPNRILAAIEGLRETRAQLRSVLF